MSHDVIKHLLDDYVTGDLADNARDAVSAHIAACEICRSEVDALQSVIARAGTLPKSIDPPADAWTGIRAAVERDKETASYRQTGDISRWRRPYLTAAAVVLAALLSSIGTALYMGARGTGTGAAAATSGSTAVPATLAAFTLEENNYLRDAAVLQDIVDQQESSLSPETVAQLKSSIRTIDEAILEARNALARDPANKTLMEMLTGTYRQKLDLLRRTTEMTRGS
ncbi:MAG TPA: zf-HC2 domain-containing protein [Gemmatimonadaceae bacterium]